ncbi:putative membrane spanning protein [Chlamydia trachomatis]|nr:putative membrane spanning protein [Chlamydia trachomatis]
MTLGIDPELIKKLFRNTMLKTKNFFLIKIRGPISSPEIDWSSAYARIALLKSYTIAGPLNSLADKLFSSLGEPTPTQTVSPLPWEVSETE